MVRKCGDANQVQEDEEKVRMDHHMRREIRSLNRQYNKLEKDVCGKRTAAFENTQSARIMRHLRDEKRELMLIIHMINSSSENKEDYWNSSQALDDMLSIYQHQMTLVQDCEDGLKDIGHYVDNIIRMINKSKYRILAAFGQHLAPERVGQRIQLLENNLYHSITSYNTQMTTCAKTRIEITSMLKERAFFFNQSRGLTRRIGWLKHHMNTIVEKANKCYDKYDDAKYQQKMIIRRNLNECLIFVQEMKDSVRFLRNDRYNRLFVELKERIREMIESAGDKVEKAKKFQLDSWEKILPRYRQIFKKVATLAGSADVEQVRQLYIGTDHENMDRFLRLCVLSNCIQALENEVDLIRATINETQENIDATKRQFYERLKGLKARELELKENVQQWNQKWEDSQEFMNALVSDFDAIFQLAGGHQSGLFKLMGASRKCSPRTIRLYLGMLEQRVSLCLFKKNHLSKLAHTVQGTKGISLISRLFKTTTPTEKQASMGGPYRATIIIPPALDKSDGDEDERSMSKHPLKYLELREICREMVEHNTALIKVLAQAGHPGGGSFAASEDLS